VAFPNFTPALRNVNASGAVTLGPTILYQPNPQGIYCSEAACDYAPELLGPWPNLQYSIRWRLLGYRPIVTLRFPMLLADGGSAMALLYQHYIAGLSGETFAALQFNLFYGASLTWRGMRPTSGWNPRPAQGKQRAGYEIDLSLEARDLIAAPGDWTAKNW
jgi:hypothetical protein